MKAQGFAKGSPVKAPVVAFHDTVLMVWFKAFLAFNCLTHALIWQRL